MGYQVGVTPVQMVTAVSSIANGGTLYEPRVVRAIIKDGQRVEVPHKALRRTVSERTASQMTAIMEAVVEEGTGKSARISGYTVAGKTGHGAQGHQRRLFAVGVQRVVRRLRAVSQA